LVIDKMMARDPKSRYQSATELITALEKTGCAVARLSWIGGRNSNPGTRAVKTIAAKPAETETQPATLSEASLPAADQYILRYKDKKGKLVKTTTEKHQIRDMIRRGLLGTDVECTKDSKGQFRPLMSFPEFAVLMKSRLLKEKGDMLAGGGMGDKFAQIDKEEARRRKMRRIKAMVWRVLTPMVVIALLAVAAWFGWREYQNTQSQSKADNSSVTPLTSPTANKNRITK
jgi:eukaryotic-like serine/threonine-protein kinase